MEKPILREYKTNKIVCVSFQYDLTFFGLLAYGTNKGTKTMKLKTTISLVELRDYCLNAIATAHSSYGQYDNIHIVNTIDNITIKDGCIFMCDQLSHDDVDKIAYKMREAIRDVEYWNKQ